jgi:hypothetical protein
MANFKSTNPGIVVKASQQESSGEAPDTPPWLSSPMNVYSEPRTTKTGKGLTTGRDDNAGASNVRTTFTSPQRRVAPEAVDTPPGLVSPTSLYSCLPSRMFQNTTRPVDGETSSAAYASSNVLERDPVRLRHPRRRKDSSLDFEAGLHKLGERAEQRFRLAGRERSAVGVGDEVRKLRDDNGLLRKEMEALRGEFRALKGVLLAKRGW